jgi:hypothetical protein
MPCSCHGTVTAGRYEGARPARASDLGRFDMVRLWLWFGWLLETHRSAREARLFARIVDERAARRAGLPR